MFNTIIRNSWDSLQAFGKQEFTQAKRTFSVSPALNTLRSIFNRAISFLPHFTKEAASHETETEKDPELAAFIKEIKEALYSNFSIPDLPRHSSTQTRINSIKEKSYLRQKHDAIKVDREVLSAFFGHTLQHQKSPFNAALTFLSEFTNKKKGQNPLNSNITSAIRNAKESELEFTEEIRNDSIKNEEQKRQRLLRKAQDLADLMPLLEQESPFFIFGKTSQEAAFQSTPLTEYLFKDMLPEEYQDLLKNDGKGLSEKIQAKILEAVIYPEEGETSSDSPIAQLNQYYQTIITRIQGPITAIFPKKLSQTIIEKTSESLRRRIFGKSSQESDRVLAEKVWAELQNNGLEQTLNHLLHDALVESQSLVMEHIQDIAESFVQKMGKPMMQGLSSFGINLQPDEKYWIEIQKGKNGKFNLILYSNDLGSSVHPMIKSGNKKGYHLPLVFSNIEIGNLSQKFFYQLLAFEASPAWGQGVSYTLADLHQHLLNHLGSPDSASSNTIITDSLRPTDRPADLLNIYLHYHSIKASRNDQIKMSRDEYTKRYQYEMPLSILQNYWQEVKKDQKVLKKFTVRTEIKRLLKKLTRSALSLNHLRKVSDEELTSLYGTVLEVQEAFDATAEKKDPYPTKPSLVVPEQMQGPIAELMNKRGFTLSHVEGIRSTLVGILGDEIGGVFDSVCDEVLPELAQDSGIQIKGLKNFSYASLRKIRENLDYTDWDILTPFFGLAKTLSLLLTYTSVKLQESLLEKMLLKFFPKLAVYTTFTNRHLAMLLIYFGPSFCKAYLPKDLYEGVFALYELCIEISTYIKRRIYFLLIRSFLKYALGKERVEQVHRVAEKLSQQVTREGELSFDFPDDAATKKEFTIIKPQPVEISSESTLEVAEAPESREQINTSKLPRLRANSFSQAFLDAFSNKAFLNCYEVDAFCLRYFVRKAEGIQSEEVDLEEITNTSQLPRFQTDFFPLVLELLHPGRLLSYPRNYSPIDTILVEHLDYTRTAIEELEKDQGLGRSKKRRKEEALWYLHEFARALPAGGFLWKNVNYPTLVLERFHTILSQFSRLVHEKENLTPEEIAENVATHYTLYAAILEVAKLDPQSGLGNQLPPTDHLGYFLHSPALKISNKKTYTQLMRVATYFGWDLDTPYKGYDFEKDPERKEYEGKDLTYKGASSWSWESFNISLLPELGRPVEGSAEESVAKKIALFSQTFPLFSREQILESDPPLEQSLHLLKKKLLKEERVDQVSDLSQKKKDQIETFKCLMEEHSDKMDPRKGILSRSFYVARFAHKLSFEITSWSLPSNESFHKNAHTLGMYSEIHYPSVTPQKTLWGRTIGSLFSGEKVTIGISNFKSSGSSAHKNSIGLRLHSNSSDESLAIARHSLAFPTTKSQSELVFHPTVTLDNENEKKEIKRDEAQDLTREETFLIEMINLDPSDQMIRAISYFGLALHRLAKPENRTLLRLYLLDFKAVNKQLRQRREIIQDLGEFFQKSCDYFLQFEDLDAFLEMSEIGRDLFMHCERFDPDVAKYFPDFKKLIRENRKDLCKSYPFLIKHYSNTEPDSGNDEAMLDIARIFYSNIWDQPIDLKSNVPYLWEPLIVEKLQSNQEFRNQVCKGILEDRGQASPSGNWVGAFPNFRNGQHQITLKGVEQPREVDPKTQILNRLKVELHEDLGKYQQQNPSRYVFPESGITVEFQSDQEPTLTRKIDGKTFRFLKNYKRDSFPFLLSTDSTLWIEEKTETPIIHEMRKGEAVSTFQAKEVEDGPNRRVLEIKSSSEYSQHLTDHDHNLTLLSGFQPLDSIEISIEERNQKKRMKRIRFSNLGLSFAIRNGQAFSDDGATPGFSISKRQKHPALRSLPNYLLLESSENKKKVHLTPLHIGELTGTYFLKNIGKIPTSPFVKKLLMGLVESPIKEERKYLTYNLDENGKLVGTDAYAITYLILFYLADGKSEKALEQFEKLEMMGRITPFPADLFTLIDTLTFLLTFSKEERLKTLLLKVAALRQENILLQPHSSPIEKSPFEPFRWLILQIFYMNYLKNHIEGLTDFDEIFLLKAISSQSKEITEDLLSKFKSDFFVINWLKEMGSNFLSEHLVMIPRVAKRYHALREKHGEGSLWSQRAESLFLHLFFGKKAPQSLQIDLEAGTRLPELKIRANRINQLFECVREFELNAALLHAKDSISYETLKSLFSTNDFTDIPILTPPLLTPNFIKKNFFYLYHLARNQPPKGWKKDRDKMENFEEQVKRFDDLLPMIVGRFNDPMTQALFIILQTAIHRYTVRTLPNAELLQNLFTLTQETKEIKSELLSVTEELESLESAGSQFSDEWSALSQKERELKDKLNERKYEEKDPETVLNELLEGMRLTTQNLFALKSIGKVTGLDQALSGKGALEILAEVAKKAAMKLFANDPSRLVQTASQLGVNLGLLASTNVSHILREAYNEEKEAIRKRLLFEKSTVIENKEHPSAQLTESMEERESHITAQLQKTFDEFFVAEERSTSPPVQAEPFEIYSDGEESTKEAFQELNKSLKDYYARPHLKKTSYRLKEGKRENELLHCLTQFQKAASAQVEKECDYITRYVNEQIQEEQIDIKVELARKKMKPQMRTLTFDEIIKFFIQGEDEKLLGNRGEEITDAKKEQLLHIKERLYLYLITTSRLQFFFSRLKSFSSDSPELQIQKIGEELKRKRVYGFKDQPERLILGKLAFELFTPTMLWEKPVSQIDKMLLSSHYRLVLQLIMGSGKTFYGIPITAFYAADGKNLITNIWPNATVDDHTKATAERSYADFGQKSAALNITRRTFWDKESLSALRYQLLRAQSQHEYLNLTKESAQALDLSLIEKGLEALKLRKANRPASKTTEEFGYLRRTLALLRKKGKANFEEAHIGFQRKKELKYPLGPSTKLQENYVSLISQIFMLLVDDPELLAITKIKAPKPIPIPESVYRRDVLPSLAQKVIDFFDCWKLSEEEKVIVLDYIEGRAKEIPEGILSNSHYKKEIDLAKGTLTTLIPFALGKTLHVDFNPSEKGDGEYAKPSEGNKNTQERSSIRSPYETVVKTAIQLLHDRLGEEQIQRLIAHWRDQARSFQTKTGFDKNKSEEVKLFKKICEGFDLYTFTNEEKEEIYRKIRDSDQATLYYLTHIISPDIRYFPRNISSNSANAASMFSSFFGDTGTPYNTGSFPIDTKTIYDPGTDGESVHEMERVTQKAESIQVLKNEDPQKIVKEIIDAIFDKDHNIRAFIDRGACANGIASIDVAQKLIEYIEEKRPDLDGVVFSHEGKLKIWKKGSKKLVPFSKSTIFNNRYLAYFPQPQTFGTDIPLPPNAVGVVSISTTTTFSELAQAFWRMRGIVKQNQRVVFVMTKEVKEAIGSDSPKMRDIITFTKKNESISNCEDNYFADILKMRDVVRCAALSKIQEAKTEKEALDLLEEFQDLFIDEITQDPSKLFGLIDAYVSPEEVFKKLRDNLNGRIQRSSFTPVERVILKEKLEQIGTGLYPEKVHSYTKNGDLIVERLDDLGVDAQVTVSQNCDVEFEEKQEQEEEQEQETNINVDAEKENDIPDGKPRPQTYMPWKEWLNPTKIDDWFEPVEPPGEFTVSSTLMDFMDIAAGRDWQSHHSGNVAIFHMKDVLGHATAEESVAVAETFTSMIYSTNNISYMISPDRSRIEPLGSYQVPPQEALVIKKNGKTRLLLLDQNEAKFWRRKLQEDRENRHERDKEVKICLLDISTQMVGAQGKNTFTKEELQKVDLQRAIVQAKFMRGDVHYSDEELKRLALWLKKETKPKMDFFHYVHRLHKRNSYGGSPLQTLVLEIEQEKDTAKKVPLPA
ncbi:MAG: DUF3638 domain-containing protein [Candidatus Algichlamydia australiensis]|nr:DUF3638 domain-containing protein [Chlamydiales bacterium]